MATLSADSWDPARYERFHAERRRPFDDLLALCRPVPGGRVVDLGCGTGDLTAELHARLGAIETVGIDSSAAMLARAQGAHTGAPGLRFEPGDLGRWSGSGVDVVFANASFHWVDGHRQLLSRVRAALAPGGQLAFQVPANFGHPSHVLAQQLALEHPFIDLLDGDPPADRGRAVLSPDTYADLLYELGATQQRVRMEVYGHVLASTREVVEWVQGTLLTPYRSRLEADAYDAFVHRYEELLLDALGAREPYFYPFRRILGWAVFS